uniref:MSP domain-containing protein n=1 Tax=Globodera pallida TaxID=36090 RepID=A0A183BQD5_GLOPA
MSSESNDGEHSANVWQKSLSLVPIAIKLAVGGSGEIKIVNRSQTPICFKIVVPDVYFRHELSFNPNMKGIVHPDRDISLTVALRAKSPTLYKKEASQRLKKHTPIFINCYNMEPSDYGKRIDSLLDEKEKLPPYTLELNVTFV